MPQEAIDLQILFDRISKGEIIPDKPLLQYSVGDQKPFDVFQDSGLNILMGMTGNGKTKFLTRVIIDIIRKINRRELPDYKIIYIDTERGESQYAFTLQHILDESNLPPSQFSERLSFFSVSELGKGQIREVLSRLHNQDKKLIIIIDHVLPLVSNFNDVEESDRSERALKALLFHGHIIVVTIHMPHNGPIKGLGNFGSALDRLASCELQIKNGDNNNGFVVSQQKSRISSKSNLHLLLKTDANGNIVTEALRTVGSTKSGKSKIKPELVAVEILKEFVAKKMSHKKELLDLICKQNNWKCSSGRYDFYKKHLMPYITFSKKGHIITEKGKSILDGKL